MAYGIISIAAYLLFVTWVVGSEEERRSDGHTLQLFGGNGMDLAAALAQAFAVQFFFIPVLKKNRKTSKHKFYLLMAFVLGALAYAYIAFMGSYGIDWFIQVFCIVTILRKTEGPKKQFRATFRQELGRSTLSKSFI